MSNLFFVFGSDIVDISKKELISIAAPCLIIMLCSNPIMFIVNTKV